MRFLSPGWRANRLLTPRGLVLPCWKEGLLPCLEEMRTGVNEPYPTSLGALFASLWGNRELIAQLTRREVLSRYRFDDIAAFADIGAFIGQPIKKIDLRTL